MPDVEKVEPAASVPPSAGMVGRPDARLLHWLASVSAEASVSSVSIAISLPGLPTCPLPVDGTATSAVPSATAGRSVPYVTKDMERHVPRQGLVYKTCRINNSIEPNKPKWEDLLKWQEQAFPGAFPDDQDI